MKKKAPNTRNVKAMKFPGKQRKGRFRKKRTWNLEVRDLYSGLGLVQMMKSKRGRLVPREEGHQPCWACWNAASFALFLLERFAFSARSLNHAIDRPCRRTALALNWLLLHVRYLGISEKQSSRRERRTTYYSTLFGTV